MTLHGGRAVVTGRRSEASLYDFGMATYDTGDTFDQSLAKGFVQLWGLPIADGGRPGRPVGRRVIVTVRMVTHDRAVDLEARACGAAGSPAAPRRPWPACR